METAHSYWSNKIYLSALTFCNCLQIFITLHKPYNSFNRISLKNNIERSFIDYLGEKKMLLRESYWQSSNVLKTIFPHELSVPASISLFVQKHRHNIFFIHNSGRIKSGKKQYCRNICGESGNRKLVMNKIWKK